MSRNDNNTCSEILVELAWPRLHNGKQIHFNPVAKKNDEQIDIQPAFMSSTTPYLALSDFLNFDDFTNRIKHATFSDSRNHACDAHLFTDPKKCYLVRSGSPNGPGHFSLVYCENNQWIYRSGENYRDILKDTDGNFAEELFDKTFKGRNRVLAIKELDAPLLTMVANCIAVFRAIPAVAKAEDALITTATSEPRALDEKYWRPGPASEENTTATRTTRPLQADTSKATTPAAPATREPQGHAAPASEEHLQCSKSLEKFMSIYNALYRAQRSIFKSDKRWTASSKWAEITTFGNDHPDSRTAHARSLMNRPAEEQLVAILAYGHEHSNIFATTTYGNQSFLFASSLRKAMSQEAMRQQENTTPTYNQSSTKH